MHDRLQLLDVHLDAAVAGQADHAAAGGQAGADGGGQVVAHGRRARVADQPLAPLQPQRLKSDHAGGAVAADDHVAGLEVLREPVDEHVGVDGAALGRYSGSTTG